MSLKWIPLFTIMIFASSLIPYLPAGGGEGRTITVNDSGGADYTSIQDAVDAAEEGDTIRVFEGTYNEVVWINITLDLIGNGSSKSIIDGTGLVGLALDNENNVYIAGLTRSEGFPVTEGCFDDTLDGANDAFISILKADGSELLYSTFLGGSDEERAFDICLDSELFIYVTGTTGSLDFPTTPGCYDSFHHGQPMHRDLFLSKLDPINSTLIYSTYIGGSQHDFPYDMELDSENNAYITGYTQSPDFPTTLGSYDIIFNGIRDAFVCVMNSQGSALIYSTFIGGLEGDVGWEITLDHDRNAYVTGYTRSTNFPTSEGCFDDSFNGTSDAFVFKLNSDGSELIHSTFIGGDDVETAFAITLDMGDNPYISGHTISSDFPTTEGCYDASINGNKDVFLVKLTPDLSTLDYSTFIGGFDEDTALSITSDLNNNIYLTGRTYSGDYPTTDGCIDDTNPGCQGSDWDYDLFVTKFSLINNISKPNVVVIFPGNNSEVVDLITIEGTAFDSNGNDTIKFIEVSIDGYEWKEADGNNNWHYDWNTKTVSNGEHILQFRAYDGEFYSEIAELVLIVENYEENDPPIVIINSPENDAEVDKIVEINGESSDADGDETIETVEISIDGSSWEVLSSTTSWSYDWNTIEFTNGEHTLRFRAYDGEDFSDIVELNLNVQNANSIPEIFIDYPEDGKEVSGMISITGTALDEDGDENIETVELSIDGGGWQVASGTASWNYNWDTATVDDGSYSIEVRAFDGIDYSDIQEITLAVKNVQVNIKPEVTITSPFPNSELSVEVYCTGRATDEDGEIQKVEMSIDGGIWFPVTGLDTWAYSWDTKNAENGIHTLSVRSYDGEDYSDETSITITVNNERDKDGDNWYEEPIYCPASTIHLNR